MFYEKLPQPHKSYVNLLYDILIDFFVEFCIFINFI